jgi:hypothetical protein
MWSGPNPENLFFNFTLQQSQNKLFVLIYFFSIMILLLLGTMNINNVNNYVYNNDVPPTMIDLWLDHGYKLGATHAVLYFDKYDCCEAMRYVFTPNTLEDLVEKIKSEDQVVINCWEYS